MVEQRQSSFCLIQEFIDFNSVFKGAIVLLLISIYGLSSVVLYLMWVTQSLYMCNYSSRIYLNRIVLHFRLWMDGARIAFLFLFQTGASHRL